MNIEGSINKFISPFEKHGYALGAGISLLSELLTGKNQLRDSITQIQNGHLHAPEWDNILHHATSDYRLSTLMLAIASYFGKDVFTNSTLKSLIEIVYKASTAFYVTDVATAGLYYSTHSPTLNNVSSTDAQSGGYTTQPLMGSTLNQSGQQNLAPYQSVYSGRATAGGLYTQASGSRLIGN